MITEKAVEAWAKAHPEAAKALVFRLAGEAPFASDRRATEFVPDVYPSDDATMTSLASIMNEAAEGAPAPENWPASAPSWGQFLVTATGYIAISPQGITRRWPLLQNALTTWLGKHQEPAAELLNAVYDILKLPTSAVPEPPKETWEEMVTRVHNIPLYDKKKV